MKKKVWITLIVVGAVALISLMVWLICMANAPAKLDTSVEPISQVNYNNYNAFSRLDYKGGELAWQHDFLRVNKLTILDDGGNTTMLTDISAPFQLAGDRIVYEKDDQLRYRIRSNGEDDLIAGDVYHFLVVEDGVLYLSGSTLYRYYWDDRNDTLAYGIYEFYYYNGRVYAVTKNDRLVEPVSPGNWREIYDFYNDQLPQRLQFQGDHAIYEFQNELHYISLTDGSTKTIPIAEGSDVSSKVGFICDEEQMYLSFQAIRYNGSIVNDIEDAHNGLWRVDSETGHQEKLSDQYFHQLYLFEGDQLFGVIDQDLYQIDTHTGRSTKIT